MKNRGRLLCAFALAMVSALPLAAQVTDNNCDPGEEPDVVVGGIIGVGRYGTIGDVTGYALGTESCNKGTCQAEWINSCPSGTDCRHPVISQHMYRLKDGRFEQIGQSWVKHSFATLNGSLCASEQGFGPACLPTSGQHLGVNCSDPYSTGLNADQSRLGPKTEINPETGVHHHPYLAQGQTGNSIYKRLQIHNDDLNPALNPGARYFAESQYVTLDDTQAGNNLNNVSYREVAVSQSGGNYNFSFVDSPTFDATIQYLPAIYSWGFEPGVFIKSIEQKFVGGSKATDLGNGFWNYEYAIHNLLSDRGIRSVTIPIPRGATITNIGFHDVDYHSGEPVDGTDWAVTIDNDSEPPTITWSTDTFETNPNANALRWGTTYNFRFDTDVGPGGGLISMAYFKPGSGSTPKWGTAVPNRCGDTLCDPFETAVNCAADCADLGAAGRVPDGRDISGNQLLVAHDDVTGEVNLEWDFSCLPDADYEIYEGAIGDFTSHGSKLCSTGGLTSATVIPGFAGAYYLVVPSNGDREGSYGADSAGNPRPQGVTACQPQSVEACF